eukprot:scaffold241328_cov37-Prasinocladus_malaysianus.AAC.1
MSLLRSVSYGFDDGLLVVSREYTRKDGREAAGREVQYGSKWCLLCVCMFVKSTPSGSAGVVHHKHPIRPICIEQDADLPQALSHAILSPMGTRVSNL